MSLSVDSLRDDCNGRIVQLQKSFLLQENELRQELQDKAAYSTTLEEKIRKQEEKHSEESKRLLSQLEESRASYEQLNEVLKASEEDRSALAAKSHALQVNPRIYHQSSGIQFTIFREYFIIRLNWVAMAWRVEWN